MWGQITQALKGWKTIIWSRFLVVLGIIMTAISMVNGDMVASVLPDQWKPWSPVIYSLALSIIGAINEWLRRYTDTAVGEKG